MPEEITIKAYRYEELDDAAKAQARQWALESGMVDDEYQLQDLIGNSLCEAGLPGLQLGYSLNCCQGDGVAFWGGVDYAYLVDRQQQLCIEVEEGGDVMTTELNEAEPGLVPGDAVRVHHTYPGDQIYTAMWREDPGAPEACRLLSLHVVNASREKPFQARYLSPWRVSEEAMEQIRRHRRDYMLHKSTLQTLQELLDEDQIHLVKISHSGQHYHENSMYVEIDLEEGLQGIADDLEIKLGEFVHDLSQKLAEEGYEEIEHRESEENLADLIIANDWTFTEDGRRTVELD